MGRRGKYQSHDLIRSEDLPTTKGQAVLLPPLVATEQELAAWRARAHNEHSIIVLDLFAGCGGMSLGFENAGLFVAAGIDADPMACQTHSANFRSRTLCLDLRTANPTQVMEELKLPRVDVVIGGPPCQGFSIVGRARVQSLTEEQRREVLARNDLYRQFLRFVAELRPLMFVMENVPNFKYFGDGTVYQSVVEESDRLGYDLYDEMLVAAEYGVPQVRRRLFIVGSRIGRTFLWPRATHRLRPVTLREAIGDLPKVEPPQLEERLPYHPTEQSPYAVLMRSRVSPENRDSIYDHVVRPVRDDDRRIFEQMQPGGRYVDIDPRYQRYDVRTFEDRYLMLDPDRPCVTITAHMAKDGYRYIHWDTTQHRTLSVREAARVQSFGDHFRFAGHRSSRYRQIGNAVPPLLAEAIGRQVRRAIQRRTVTEGDIWQLGLPGLEHRAAIVRSEAE